MPPFSVSLSRKYCFRNSRKILSIFFRQKTTMYSLRQMKEGVQSIIQCMENIDPKCRSRRGTMFQFSSFLEQRVLTMSTMEWFFQQLKNPRCYLESLLDVDPDRNDHTENLQCLEKWRNWLCLIVEGYLLERPKKKPTKPIQKKKNCLLKNGWDECLWEPVDLVSKPCPGFR